MRAEAVCLIALTRGDTLPPPNLHNIDPNGFCDLASRQGVSALAHWQLAKDHARDGMWRDFPPTIASRLKMAYLHHSARSHRLAIELCTLQSELNAQGVDAIIFKGPWLAFGAYPSPGTRPVGDIDVGVHEQDYEPAVTALRKLGYWTRHELPASSMAALRSAHYGKQLCFRSCGVFPVELHFRMINMGPPGMTEDWLWRRRRTIAVGGARLSIPGSEAMLLHLLLHANQHGFSMLRLLYDVHFALQGMDEHFDLPHFLELVESLRCGASAYFGLLLARDLTRASVPPEILNALRPGWLRRGTFSVAWRLPASCALEANSRHRSIEAPLFYLLEMGTLSQKLGYLRGIVQEAGGLLCLLRRAARISAS